MTPAALALDRAEIEALLFREARLLDEWRLEEWLTLFTPDAVYWIPIDDRKSVDRNTAIILDTPTRREERVYHLLNNRFASQTPRSRTVHAITNVEIEPASESRFLVHSTQVIYEVRTGDFRQNGLGDVRTLVARVEHLVEQTAAGLAIAGKKILLIDRDIVQRNLMFII
jgi:3-phenylpropionate/cinnamic acid dioxygenase small subunit